MVIELLRGVSNLLGLMEKLKTLFDPQLIENASPSESMDHYERRLGYICREMLKYVLVIGDKRYDMLEIEVYLTAPKHGHPDPYCHGHPLQKKPGAWVNNNIANALLDDTDMKFASFFTTLQCPKDFVEDPEKV